MPDEPSDREEPVNGYLSDFLRKAEVFIYYVVAVLLSLSAAAAIAYAGVTLWKGLVNWTIPVETLRVLDQLLVVLMLVEILHTIRISIRSHILFAAEPFLVVGLIASIRRVLIISLELTSLTRDGRWSTDGSSIFHASMIELGLLVILIPVLVFSITLLRRKAPAPKELMENLHYEALEPSHRLLRISGMRDMQGRDNRCFAINAERISAPARNSAARAGRQSERHFRYRRKPRRSRRARLLMGVCGGTFRSWRVFGWPAEFCDWSKSAGFSSRDKCCLSWRAGECPGTTETGPSVFSRSASIRSAGCWRYLVSRILFWLGDCFSASRGHACWA